MLIIQTAWSYMSVLPRTFSHIASAFQALTDSLLDSWLLPSANGLEPEAHAWPEYGSKLRYCGKSAVASRGRDVGDQQVGDRGELVGQGRVVLGHHGGGVQQVAVVEVVVVQLVGAEGGLQPDHRLDAVVVDEALGRAGGAALAGRTTSSARRSARSAASAATSVTPNCSASVIRLAARYSILPPK